MATEKIVTTTRGTVAITTTQRPCPHGAQLTRTEAAKHMACTAYGREVNPRTVDRWADAGLISRTKVGGLQWVRFDRDELDQMGAGQAAGAGNERVTEQ